MITTEKTKYNKKDSINITELLHFYRSKWYWFIISFIIVYSFAILYLLTSAPIYSRSASLMVKENSDSQSAIAGEIGESFSNMGLSGTKNNVNNELHTLLSPSLMMDVVSRLHLNMDYCIEKGLCKQTIYDSTLPVTVSITKPSNVPYGSFTMNIFANGNVELFNFKSNNEEIGNGTISEGNLSDTIDSPLGRLKVSPTPYYKKGSVSTIYVSRSSLYNTARKYVSNLTVSLDDKGSTILNLTLKDNCIQRAEDVLNTLISIYNVNWIKDKNQIAASTSTFIDGRLKVIKSELTNVDEKISSFKRKNLLPDVKAASNMYLEKNKEMGSQILILNNQLYMAHFIRDYLKDESNKNRLLPSTGIENLSINSQISEYNTNQLLRNNLVKNSSEQNPLVTDIDQTLKAMRKAIGTSVDNQTLNLQSQLKNLQQNEQKVNNSIANNPSQAEYLIAIERQQKIKESIYLFLLQKREENELSQAFSAYNTRVINPPNGNMTPVSPKKDAILMLAFILGFGLPAIIIYILRNADTSVHGQKDFADMSIPFIGEIPLLKKKRNWFFSHNKQNKKTPAVKIEKGNRDIINESFRILRTNLEFMVGKDKKSNVIVLSSFIPDSGKSFITLNIAVTMAISGKEVLVIDGDLRSASMSRHINSSKKGLSNFLSEQINNPDDIIVTDKNYENLKFIPIGTIPPNPTELLIKDRFGELIKTMRSRYDYIFIDCPPINIVADTSIIEKSADRMIFIIRAKQSDKSMLTELENIYNEHKYKNMAVVLNGTVKNDNRYEYKYKYYKKYSANYGE